ncbi:MAG: hypothetical protein H7336_13250 [Bacteriovorax sp.]|nr:hypothetical protein [Bacteriovorax sp.]
MKNMFTSESCEKILKAAAIYSLFWGLLITLVPKVILIFFGVEIPHIIEFWQLTGMFVGVMGVGYYIASQDTAKHWPIIFVGFLGNLMGTFVFAKAMLSGSLPVFFSTILLVSTAIWLAPFYVILQGVYAELVQEDSPPKQFNDLIRFVRTSQKKTLLELSNDQNVLLVFVRHFGCTFCRETVSEMAIIDQALVGRKLTLVFVHMSDKSYGDEFFSKYYDHPVHHISDPGRSLYKSLNLRRGSLYQLFGPMTWIRGIYAGVFKGHGLGEFEGDSMQLGGVFVLSHGQVIFEQKAKSASHLFQITTLPEV